MVRAAHSPSRQSKHHPKLTVREADASVWEVESGALLSHKREYICLRESQRPLVQYGRPYQPTVLSNLALLQVTVVPWFYRRTL